MLREERFVEADAFFAKDKSVTRPNRDLEEVPSSSPGKIPAPRAVARLPHRLHDLCTLIEIGMMLNLDQMPVIKTCTTHSVVVDTKPKFAHQVKRTTGGPAKPRNIPSIGRDLRFNEDHVKGSHDGAGSQSLGRRE